MATTIYFLIWQCVEQITCCQQHASTLLVRKPTQMLHVKLNLVHPIVAQPVLLHDIDDIDDDIDDDD